MKYHTKCLFVLKILLTSIGVISKLIYTRKRIIEHVFFLNKH